MASACRGISTCAGSRGGDGRRSAHPRGGSFHPAGVRRGIGCPRRTVVRSTTTGAVLGAGGRTGTMPLTTDLGSGRRYGSGGERAGAVAFAGVLLVIVGLFHAIQGIVAIASEDFYTR